jgi:hypothetical protein
MDVLGVSCSCIPTCSQQKPFEETIKKLSEENATAKNTIFTLKNEKMDLEVRMEIFFFF